MITSTTPFEIVARRTLTRGRRGRAPWPGALAVALLALAAPLGAQPSPTTAPARPALAPDVVNAAIDTSSRSAFLRAQVLLDRAGFSPGEIDASWGSNSQQALRTFQASRELPVTGRLDAGTWAALATDTSPALVTYVVTDADVAGPFTEVPEDMMQKAQLARLDYSSPIEALAERFHVSPRLLEFLNTDVVLDAAGSTIVVPNVADVPPPAKAAAIVVDGSDHVLQLVDQQGKVVAQFPSTTGSEHDPLPIGEWKVQGVARMPVFHYNPDLFWDADAAHAKAKVAPGPNNPVGVAWIDLSKEHYGIHGTPEPATVGKTQSHGCIRLTNWAVARVAEAVGPGTKVILRQ